MNQKEKTLIKNAHIVLAQRSPYNTIAIALKIRRTAQPFTERMNLDNIILTSNPIKHSRNRIRHIKIIRLIFYALFSRPRNFVFIPEKIRNIILFLLRCIFMRKNLYKQLQNQIFLRQQRNLKRQKNALGQSKQEPFQIMLKHEITLQKSKIRYISPTLQKQPLMSKLQQKVLPLYTDPN